jgi:hypothetical protein
MAEAPTIATYFQQILSTQGDRGPVGAILQQLAAGTLTAEAFARIADDHGVRREAWFRGQILDLFIGFVRTLLDTVRLGPEHRALLLDLRRQLAIPDGEFIMRRPAEVAAIVDEQLDRILADGIIDGAEELEQVEIQAAFGLAYDDYLLVSRRAFERVYSELLPLAAHSPEAARKLHILGPLYLLVTERPRTLGALF